MVIFEQRFNPRIRSNVFAHGSELAVLNSGNLGTKSPQLRFTLRNLGVQYTVIVPLNGERDRNAEHDPKEHRRTSDHPNAKSLRSALWLSCGLRTRCRLRLVDAASPKDHFPSLELRSPEPAAWLEMSPAMRKQIRNVHPSPPLLDKDISPP